MGNVADRFCDNTIPSRETRMMKSQLTSNKYLIDRVCKLMNGPKIITQPDLLEIEYIVGRTATIGYCLDTRGRFKTCTSFTELSDIWYQAASQLQKYSTDAK